MSLRGDVFTIIMDTYFRPALLKEAVEALFRQTYGNVEIVLVNNSGTPETVDYLHDAARRDKRVKLVHFENNQYSEDDPLKLVECYNAGLKKATGDYIWYQADDDLIAHDYAEKMVALFQGHPECITAAGLPVAVNLHGQRIDQGPRTSNFRPRYMPGHLLALDVVRGGRTMFSAPGTIFTIRREVLLNAGGYHRATELSHLYGIVPFGVTGFDETALFFWRRHGGQLNTQLSAAGWIGFRESFSLLQDWDIERRWRVFGNAVAKRVVSSLRRRVCRVAANWFVISAWHCRIKAALRILRDGWSHPWFWWEVPGQFVKETKRLLSGSIKRSLKPLVQCVFEWWPSLASLSPRLSRLHERVRSGVGQVR